MIALFVCDGKCQVNYLGSNHLKGQTKKTKQKNKNSKRNFYLSIIYLKFQNYKSTGNLKVLSRNSSTGLLLRKDNNSLRNFLKNEARVKRHLLSLVLAESHPKLFIAVQT